jgi:hypothetical protein
VIVGGGNSAGQAAIWLADRGHTRLPSPSRGTDLAESMSHYLVDSIAGRPDIEVRYQTEVRDLTGVAMGWSGSRSRTSPPRCVRFCRPRLSSSWSAPSRTPSGSPDPSCSTTAATSSPGRHSAPGRVTSRRRPAAAAIPTCWRPAHRAYFAAGDVRSSSVKRARRRGRRGLHRGPVRQRVPGPPRRLRHPRPFRPAATVRRVHLLSNRYGGAVILSG